MTVREDTGVQNSRMETFQHHLSRDTVCKMESKITLDLKITAYCHKDVAVFVQVCSSDHKFLA